MTQADLKRICTHPATYAQELLDRAEAAEARADEYKRQWVEATTELENIGESWPQLKSRTDELAAQLATVRSALTTTLLAMRECAKHIAMVHIAELDMAENAEQEALAALGMVRVNDNEAQE